MQVPSPTLTLASLLCAASPIVAQEATPAVDKAELRRVVELAFQNRIKTGEQALLIAAVKDGDLLKAAANPRLMQGYAVGR